jgi:alpha-tubulin suppressor-like RCC1 family protein
MGSAGCSLLLDTVSYRDCSGAECGPTDAAIDTADAPSTDSATDVVDASKTSCTKNADCAQSTPACSQGFCTAVDSLVHSTSDSQCALLADQTLWCWGNNQRAQLGRGGQVDSYVPAPVTVMPKGALVQSAGVGFAFACALTTTGDVYCWGKGGGGSNGPNAAQVVLPSPAVQLGVANNNACARLIDKSVFCWGGNDYGDIGCDGDAGNAKYTYLSPHLLLAPPFDVAQISPGQYATCARKPSSDTVYCFGNLAWGNLGDGRSGNDSNCQSSTITVPGGAVTELVTADLATCARNATGTYCWGVNFESAYGFNGILIPTDPTQFFTTPKELPVPADTQQVSVGFSHTCIRRKGGKVTCWGDNSHLETGNQSPQTLVLANEVVGLGPVKDLAAQRWFTCALQVDGQVLCWGVNENQGADTATPTPVTW